MIGIVAVAAVVIVMLLVTEATGVGPGFRLSEQPLGLQRTPE